MRALLSRARVEQAGFERPLDRLRADISEALVRTLSSSRLLSGEDSRSWHEGARRTLFVASVAAASWSAWHAQRLRMTRGQGSSTLARVLLAMTASTRLP
eukprot:70988-Pleurochrysis_carterae.AAC.1